MWRILKIPPLSASRFTEVLQAEGCSGSAALAALLKHDQRCSVTDGRGGQSGSRSAPSLHDPSALSAGDSAAPSTAPHVPQHAAVRTAGHASILSGLAAQLRHRPGAQHVSALPGAHLSMHSRCLSGAQAAAGQLPGSWEQRRGQQTESAQARVAEVNSVMQARACTTHTCSPVCLGIALPVAAAPHLPCPCAACRGLAGCGAGSMWLLRGANANAPLLHLQDASRLQRRR